MATRRLVWICLSVLALLAPGAAKSTSVANLEKLCPQARPGQAGFKPPWKSCLISSTALVASMGQIAAGLSTAVARCAATLNIQANCAAPIGALFTPMSKFIAAGTATSASCAKRVSELPPDIQLSRRLQSESADQQKWSYAECGVDISSAIMAIGQLALGFNGATKNCPAATGQPLQERGSRSRCMQHAAFTFFSVARLVVFLALASEHCIPGPQTDSMCVAAAATLVASSFSVTFNGNAIYQNCQVGPEGNAIIAGTSVLLNRRRLSSTDEFIGALSKQAGFSRRLTQSEFITELANESAFENVDDLWLSMGYNLSDPNAAWLEEDPGEIAVIKKGRQMLKELQTTREEPPKELLEYSPEEAPPMTVPEVLIDPQDDASTLSCSEKDVVYMLHLP